MGLFALGSLAYLGHSYFVRPRAQPAPPATTAVLQPAPAAAEESVSVAVPPSPEQVAGWVDASTGEAPGPRAAAITALASVPPEQAVPALRSVLRAGDPVADRPLALQSLREIAMGSGDADGSIRDLLREVIYHGDSDAIGQQAQTMLDEFQGYLGLAEGGAPPLSDGSRP